MNALIKAKSVHFDDCYLYAELEDGCLISTPMNWYKELQEASVKEDLISFYLSRDEH